MICSTVCKLGRDFWRGICSLCYVTKRQIIAGWFSQHKQKDGLFSFLKSLQNIIARKHQQRKHQSSRSSPHGLQYLEKKPPLRIQMFSVSSTSCISRTVSHSGSYSDQAVCENSQEKAAERADNSSTTKPGVFLPDRSPTTR